MPAPVDRLGEVAGAEAQAEVDRRIAFEDLVHLVCRVPGRMASVVDHARAPLPEHSAAAGRASIPPSRDQTVS